MLLKITEHCSMGCSHCISDCKPDGKSMSDQTFDQVIKFMNAHSHSLTGLVVSGGEPFEHPKFIEYLRRLNNELNPITQIAVTTNGVWICNHIDEFKEIHEEMRFHNSGRLVVWQITSVEGLYPINIIKKYPEAVKELEKMTSVFIDTKLVQIYPQGRAEENGMDWKAVGPKCFNVRSIANGIENFIDLLATLTYHEKMCTPCIEWDGSIKCGESQLCPVCSGIWKSDMEIMQDIRNFKCLACQKPISRMPENYKSILN